MGFATAIDGAVDAGIPLALTLIGDMTSILGVLVGLSIVGVAFAVVAGFVFNR